MRSLMLSQKTQLENPLGSPQEPRQGRLHTLENRLVVLIVGALVAASLISRFVWLIARRWPDSIRKAVLINAVSAMIPWLRRLTSPRKVDRRNSIWHC